MKRSKLTKLLLIIIIIIINVMHELHNKQRKREREKIENNRTYKLVEFHTTMSLNTKWKILFKKYFININIALIHYYNS